MLRYFSNGIPRSSVSSPLAARITRVRGARPAVFCKVWKNTNHHTGSVSHAVRRHPRSTFHSFALERRATPTKRRRSDDEGRTIFYPPPPASPPPSRPRASVPRAPTASRARGIKGCPTSPSRRFIPLDANARGRDEFPRVPTRSQTHERIHPARRSPVSTLASPRVASTIVPPPHRRHPPHPTSSPDRDDASHDVRADARRERARGKKYIEPISARAPLTVPLARTFAVVDTVVFIIVPIIVLAESSRRRVTSRRGGGGCGPRGVGVVFF